MFREADRDCPLCPRLVEFRVANRVAFPTFHNAPVPAFGSLDAALLIVGLAPGLKGANQTGRPFTNDYAGDLLYPTLLKLGLATRPLRQARRRRAEIGQYAHHQRRALRAAAEQAGAGRRKNLPRPFPDPRGRGDEKPEGDPGAGRFVARLGVETVWPESVAVQIRPWRASPD